jgi:hypothetical protein
MAAARSSGITSFITLRLLRKGLRRLWWGEGGAGSCRVRGPEASVVLWLPGPNIIRQRDPKSQTKSQRQPTCQADPATRPRHSPMPHQAMASTRRHAHWHACAAGVGSTKWAVARPALWGAKRGANDGRHQATPGHCQRSPSLVNGTLSLVEPCPATGLIRLTSERPVVRNHLRPLFCQVRGQLRS